MNDTPDARAFHDSNTCSNLRQVGKTHAFFMENRFAVSRERTAPQTLLDRE
jgi:hypothetical protein